MPLDLIGRIHTWKVRLDIDARVLPPASFENASFWYVGFHDAQNNEIYRKDISSAEIDVGVRGRNVITIIRTFDSEEAPATWTVWPKSRSERWLKKICAPLTPSHARSSDSAGTVTTLGACGTAPVALVIESCLMRGNH
jgi:hypothetical protein